MKSLLLSIFLLISSLVLCQDWFPFPLGQRSYFEQNGFNFNSSPLPNNVIQSYETDSVRIEINKSTYYFNYKNPNIYPCYNELIEFINTTSSYYNYFNPYSPDSIVYESDSLRMYFPNFTSPIVIIPSVLPGESWFSDFEGSNYNKLKFTCDLNYFGNILNTLDSIKIISIQTYQDSLAVSSSFNSKKLILSKNYGLKEFFPFNGTLLGFKSNSISEGFIEPKLQDYFNLTSGDVIIWKHFMDPGFTEPDSIHYYKDSIVSVNSTPDSVKYFIIRTTQQGVQTNEYQLFKFNNMKGLFSSTCSMISGDVLNSYDPYYILNSSQYDIFESSPMYYDSNNMVNKSFETASANWNYFGGCDFGITIDYSSNFSFNTKYGLYYKNQWVWESIDTWTIEGSVIDGIQEGILWNDIVTSIESNSSIFEFNIYPNPVQKNNTIQIEGKDLEKAEIINLQGKIVYQSELTNNQLNIDINQGIYFLKVTNSKGINTSKKLIVN